DSMSGASPSCATAGSSAQTRTRSRANIGPTREDSRREHLRLHPRARRRARPAGHGRPGRALSRRPASRRRRDGRRRPDPGPRCRPRARRLPPRLRARVAVLPTRRARARPRGRPLPRPAARVVLLVHDLPRELTVEQLAELFEGRTTLVERLAERESPLDAANEVIAELSESEKLEALNAHPAIG